MSTVSYSVPRRKSAHGRLQSSADTEVGGEEGVQGGRGGRGRSRRVKSAREIREISPEGAGVKRDTSAWGRTQYGDDFGHKQPLTPVPVRPISPTRRNNPHPAMVSNFIARTYVATRSHVICVSLMVRVAVFAVETSSPYSHAQEVCPASRGGVEIHQRRLL